MKRDGWLGTGYSWISMYLSIYPSDDYLNDALRSTGMLNFDLRMLVRLLLRLYLSNTDDTDDALRILF